MEWIDIDDELPNEKTVVVVLEKHSVDAKIFNTVLNVPSLAEMSEDKEWFDFNTTDQLECVTHWMPLPEPPKN